MSLKIEICDGVVELIIANGDEGTKTIGLLVRRIVDANRDSGENKWFILSNSLDERRVFFDKTRKSGGSLGFAEHFGESHNFLHAEGVKVRERRP